MSKSIMKILTKNKIILFLIPILICLLTSTQKTQASSYQTSQTINIEENQISIIFENNTSSKLYNLSYILHLPSGETVDSSVVKELESDKKDTQVFEFDRTSLSEGRHLVYIKGQYYVSDNPYSVKFPHPFLASTTTDIKMPSNLKFKILESNTKLDKQDGQLTTTIQNLTEEPLPLLLELVLPSGIALASQDTTKQIELDPGETKVIEFDLVNQWRNAGESSNIILRLSEKDTNYSLVEPVTFNIKFKEYKLSNSIVIALVLALLFLISKYYFKVPQKILHIVILGFIVFFIFEFIPLKYILSDTTTTGGDTFTHYVTAKFAQENLFSKFKISGWYPGTYAGFPLFVFYMPLPFILMSILSIIIKFNVAFKLVTISGVICLPVAAYILSKDLKFPKYGGLIAASLTLIFLLNESYTMYGGNVLSTLAGEFSHGIGLVFLLIFTGKLFKGIEKQKYLRLNSILLFLIGFTHPYPFIIAVLQQIYFLLPRFNNKEKIKQNFIYLAKMNILAFLLFTFWILPTIFRVSYTTRALSEFWPLKFAEIFPNNFKPFLIIFAFTAIFALIRKKSQILFLIFSMYVSLIFLIFSSKVGLVNIRFIPFITLYMFLVAAYGISSALKLLPTKLPPAKDLALLVLIGLVFFFTSKTVRNAPPWAKWNYSGIENKPYTDMFFEMMDYIKDLPGNDRVVYEHSTMQENFGTIRAFETLYEFTEKPTLEGLYLQASPSSAFAYYIQSEVSEISSNVLTYRKYSTLNIEGAVDHLEQFNVRYFIAVSDKVKEQLSRNDNFELKKEIFPYEIYELKTNTNSYVEVLQEAPIFVESNNWQDDAYSWFINHDPNVYVNNPDGPTTDFATCNQEIETLESSTEKLRFKTKNLHCPHLIKISYFPNWKVKGADKIYQASPNFMLVYPENEEVELTYSRVFAWRIGDLLTISAVAILLLRPKFFQHK